MLDPKKILDEFLGSNIPGTGSSVRQTAGSAVQKAKDNPLATGAIAAVLLGTGTGRALTGSALKLGGLAAVAGLAYKAYQNYQSGQAPKTATGQEAIEAPPDRSGFHPSEAPQGEDAFALTLVRAMIAAARADGHIDADERTRILGRMKETGVDEDVEAFLASELASPVDMDTLVSSAQSEGQKVELYTASRLAIDPETRAERGYLDMLAGRLKLPDPLVEHIDATVSSAKG